MKGGRVNGGSHEGSPGSRKKRTLRNNSSSGGYGDEQTVASSSGGGSMRSLTTLPGLSPQSGGGGRGQGGGSSARQLLTPQQRNKLLRGGPGELFSADGKALNGPGPLGTRPMASEALLRWKAELSLFAESGRCSFPRGRERSPCTLQQAIAQTTSVCASNCVGITTEEAFCALARSNGDSTAAASALVGLASTDADLTNVLDFSNEYHEHFLHERASAKKHLEVCAGCQQVGFHPLRHEIQRLCRSLNVSAVMRAAIARLDVAAGRQQGEDQGEHEGQKGREGLPAIEGMPESVSPIGGYRPTYL